MDMLDDEVTLEKEWELLKDDNVRLSFFFFFWLWRLSVSCHFTAKFRCEGEGDICGGHVRASSTHAWWKASTYFLPPSRSLI